jgi:hypothetical protein
LIPPYTTVHFQYPGQEMAAGLLAIGLVLVARSVVLRISSWSDVLRLISV